MKRTLSTMALSIALWLTLADKSAMGQIYNSTINTVVGAFPYGNGGPPAQALLTFPAKMAIDSKGAIYIADTYNQMVRKIVGGQISTVAGTGILGFSGDGHAAVGAQFNYPAGVAADATGNVYVYDGANEVIRKIDTNGVITTFAGTPRASGSKGDGGPATRAQLSLAISGNVAVDSAGNVYIADYGNHVVRKVTVGTGIISVFA